MKTLRRLVFAVLLLAVAAVAFFFGAAWVISRGPEPVSRRP